MDRRRVGVLLAIVLALPTVGGCRDAAARSGMAGAYPGIDPLVQAALDALAARDREQLEALLVTRKEHETLLWEQLPERNYFPFSYVRLISEENTDKGISKALARWGGQELELVRVEFTKEREVYSDFTLHRGARVWARRKTDGEEGVIPFLDVVVERHGGFKLLDIDD
ncbi:MAG: hypothetical protein P8Y21_13780 [Gemmatimonadales bacterium]